MRFSFYDYGNKRRRRERQLYQIFSFPLFLSQQKERGKTKEKWEGEEERRRKGALDDISVVSIPAFARPLHNLSFGEEAPGLDESHEVHPK